MQYNSREAHQEQGAVTESIQRTAPNSIMKTATVVSSGHTEGGRMIIVVFLVGHAFRSLTALFLIQIVDCVASSAA
jgi:hypothetical protein